MAVAGVEEAEPIHVPALHLLLVALLELGPARLVRVAVPELVGVDVERRHGQQVGVLLGERLAVAAEVHRLKAAARRQRCNGGGT